MMNNLDITAVEKTIARLVKTGGVSANVYNNRPKSALKVDEFVVVNVSGPVEDMGCFGTATIGIDLFARDVNNFKNSMRLKYMYDRLLQAIPAKCDIPYGDYIDADYSRSDSFAGGPSFSDFSKSDFALADFFGNYGSYLIDGNPTILGDTPDDYGFTARLINFKVIIKIA